MFKSECSNKSGFKDKWERNRRKLKSKCSNKSGFKDEWERNRRM